MPHRRKNINVICENLKKKSLLDNVSVAEGLGVDVNANQVGHINSYNQTAGYSITCFHCNDIFSSASDIQKHMFDKHVRSNNNIEQQAASGRLTFVEDQSLKYPNAGICYENEDNSPPSVTKRRKLNEECTGGSETWVQSKFACEICGFVATSPAALTIHCKTHSSPGSRHKCHLCEFSTKTYAELASHGESHHRLDNGTFQCTVCSKCFETYSKARRHVWMTHVDMNVVCQECGKKFSRMDRLRKHFSSTHSDIPVGNCMYCGKGFRRKDKLKDHQEICATKTGNTSSNNRGHPSIEPKRVHTVKKRPGPKCVVSTLEPLPDAAYCRFAFRCDLCQVGFKKHGDLLIHAEARHRDHIIPMVLPMVDVNQQISDQESASILGQQYSCPHCQVMWSTMVEIKLHVALDHPEYSGSSFKFECPFCVPALGRNYPARERLVRHLRRQHRQLLTPLLRNNSCTNDQDVASHIEIGIPRSSVRANKSVPSVSSTSASKSASPVPTSEELSCSNNFISPLPPIDYAPMAHAVNATPVLGDNSFTPVLPSDGVCEVASPNFFSCGSLTDLSTLTPGDTAYSTITVVQTTNDQDSSSVAVTHSNQTAYDSSNLVCFADPISGLINAPPVCQDPASDPPYILATSPLPLSTSVLAACFDSPLTGPLNSHAYQLLE